MNNFSWQDPQLAQGKREATNPFWGRADTDEVVFTGVDKLDNLEGRGQKNFFYYFHGGANIYFQYY